MGKKSEVGAVILNWNNARLTKNCVEALQKSDYDSLKFIVVDNGSTDGSADAIAAGYPGITLVRNSANLGFAEGSNQGIRLALKNGAAYVLLLNNDAIVDKGMVSRLVETAAARSNRIAVSPKMYGGPDRNRLWFVHGRTSLWTGIFWNPAYNAPATRPFDPLVPIEYASGCCVLIPREIISAVGGFDPRFFAYCEDVDWSLRTRRAGFGLVCDTRAELWHYTSSTGRRNPARMRYLMTRNHLWTMRKHASLAQFVVFALAFYPVRCLLRVGRAVRHAQWACIPAEFRGAFEGFFAPLAPVRATLGAAETRKEGG